MGHLAPAAVRHRAGGREAAALDGALRRTSEGVTRFAAPLRARCTNERGPGALTHRGHPETTICSALAQYCACSGKPLGSACADHQPRCPSDFFLVGFAAEAYCATPTGPAILAVGFRAGMTPTTSVYQGTAAERAPRLSIRPSSSHESPWNAVHTRSRSTVQSPAAPSRHRHLPLVDEAALRADRAVAPECAPECARHAFGRCRGVGRFDFGSVTRRTVGRARCVHARAGQPAGAAPPPDR